MHCRIFFIVCIILLCCCKNNGDITGQINYISMALLCPVHENRSKRANNRGAMFSKQRLAVRPAGQDILSASHGSCSKSVVWCILKLLWSKNLYIKRFCMLYNFLISWSKICLLTFLFLCFKLPMVKVLKIHIFLNKIWITKVFTRVFKKERQKKYVNN